MSHGHNHDHGVHLHSHVAAGADPRKALIWALGLNGIFLIIEVVVGLTTGSLALLSDAAHMVSDVGAIAIALAATQLARRPPSLQMTYGFHRAEILGAFLNGISLVFACGFILWEAIDRLASGPPAVPGLPVLIVGIIGLGINLGSAWALYRSGSDNLNIRGAMVHMLADALGSAGAIVAAVFIMGGFPSADPIISLFTAALVAWGAWPILRDSTRVLLEMPPRDFDIQALGDDLNAVPGVIGAHDLHVWSLDGSTPIASVHLVISDGHRSEAVQAGAYAVMTEAHGVEHATIQVERSADCPTKRCDESEDEGCEDEDSDHGH